MHVSVLPCCYFAVVLVFTLTRPRTLPFPLAIQLALVLVFDVIDV